MNSPLIISHMRAYHFIFVLTTFCVLFVAHDAYADELPYRDGEVIVKYKETILDTASAPGRQQMAVVQKKSNVRTKNEIPAMNIVLFVSDEKSTRALIEDFENDPAVEYAEPNYKRTLSFTPNDALFVQQWSHNNTGQAGGVSDADGDISEMWDVEKAGAQIIVAVIDSGVRYTHEDMRDNMWSASMCVSDTGAAIAGGCPGHGWDYENNDNTPSDSDGHGTAVAGVIAARTHNTIGSSGMSRYNNTKIMALRFGLDTISEIKAINFAKNNGAHVINASFSGPGFSQSEKNAIDAFPGVFVAAAGNGGSDAIGDNIDADPEYPCAHTSSNVICVAASDRSDQLTPFSNYSATRVDVAAPGEALFVPSNGSDISYISASGTSFASPFTAGIAAALRSRNITLSAAQIRAQILNTVDAKPAFTGRVSSHGRVNGRAALASIPAPVPLTPIYRLYDTKTGVHLYTRGEADRDKILNKFPVFEFTDGGPAFYASLRPKTGLAPIYRLYNTRSGVHLYTRGVADRDKILSKFPVFEFTDGGPAFYASLSNDGTTPIYRLYNTKTGVHLYTRGIADRNKILSKFPVFEFTDGGPAFYAQL